MNSTIEINVILAHSSRFVYVSIISIPRYPLYACFKFQNIKFTNKFLNSYFKRWVFSEIGRNIALLNPFSRIGRTISLLNAFSRIARGIGSFNSSSYHISYPDSVYKPYANIQLPMPTPMPTRIQFLI